MNLDRVQEAIVKCNHKRLIVIAGPGSGKSTVVSHRCHYLVARENVRKMYILTFSHAAADVLKEKLSAIHALVDALLRLYMSFS